MAAYTGDAVTVPTSQGESVTCPWFPRREEAEPGLELRPCVFSVDLTLQRLPLQTMGQQLGRWISLESIIVTTKQGHIA